MIDEIHKLAELNNWRDAAAWLAVMFAAISLVMMCMSRHLRKKEWKRRFAEDYSRNFQRSRNMQRMDAEGFDQDPFDKGGKPLL